MRLSRFRVSTAALTCWLPKRSRWTWWLCLGALSVAVGALWWGAPDSPSENIEGGALSVSQDQVQGRRGRVGAAIVVTLRWGVTDRHSGQSRTESLDGVNWDGFIALDCGRIERVEPLAFELADGRGGGDPARADVLGDVVKGALGDQRVYWRSRTQTGWDGLRAKIRACAPVVGGPGRPLTSTLVVRTAQRAYTARLDWSANDFVALTTQHSDQKLEVYINAQQNERSLKGARITHVMQKAPQARMIR